MGDVICIFQEDNERQINSTVIPLSIVMLIFHLKGQRVSGSCERAFFCSPSPSHSPLYFNHEWRQSTCQSWEHWEAMVPLQPPSAFPACSGHGIYNVAMKPYSPIHSGHVRCDEGHHIMVMLVVCLGTQKQPYKVRALSLALVFPGTDARSDHELLEQTSAWP